MHLRYFILLLTVVLSPFAGVNSQVRAQTQNPKVIAIGDSVTDDFGGGGWRGPLKARLAAVGQAITYVGTRTDAGGDHEAYGGAASCDFFTDRRSFMTTEYGKLATWDIRASLAATSPSIAIIDIGTNNYIDDFYFKLDGAAVPCGLNPGSLQRLWDAVVYHPGITGVVIATVEDSWIADGTENVNAIVRKYVADRVAQGKNVCLGALPASFAGLTTDRYHLSTAGKDAVAAALVGPTRTAIAGACAGPPPTTGLSVTVTPGIVVRGNSVTVTWSGIVNPSATDWIGLYQVGAPNSPFWEWEYVSCGKTATTARVSGTCTMTIPVSPLPGNFNLRLFSNNVFNLIATSNTFVLQ